MYYVNLKISVIFVKLNISRKLFIKNEHEAIIDEMFEFPKGRNDDLLDGLWYAVISTCNY